MTAPLRTLGHPVVQAGVHDTVEYRRVAQAVAFRHNESQLPHSRKAVPMPTRTAAFVPVLSVTGALLLAALSGGCSARTDSTPPHAAALPASESSDASVAAAQRQANLAKLNDQDRALAEAQGSCAVADHPLGSMGMPLKLTINDQPVFLCCKGCEREATANPEKTLAKVAQLKAQTQAEKAP